MRTLYQSSKDVPTEVLSERLNQLSHEVSRNRERIDAEFTMRIPAEVDRDADLVMSEAAVRLEALQAECEKLRKDAERYRWLRGNGAFAPSAWGNGWALACGSSRYSSIELDASVDAAMQELRNAND